MKTMKQGEISQLVKNKCEELGGEFEFWPDLGIITCTLNSIERVPELMELIRKVGFPDDAEYFSFEVKARTGEGSFSYRISKYRDDADAFYYARADVIESGRFGSNFYEIMRVVGKKEVERLKRALDDYKEKSGLSKVRVHFSCDRKGGYCSIDAVFDARPDRIDPAIDREIIESAKRLWNPDIMRVGERTYIVI